jgi:hypothetical protein
MEVFIIHHLQNTQECGSLLKILTYKSINNPYILFFSPFYSPTNSFNCLTIFNILTLVSRVVLLTMSLHFDLSTYLLFCQVDLQ